MTAMWRYVKLGFDMKHDEIESTRKPYRAELDINDERIYIYDLNEKVVDWFEAYDVEEMCMTQAEKNYRWRKHNKDRIKNEKKIHENLDKRNKNVS